MHIIRYIGDILSWFNKILNPERILAAAIWVDGEYFTGPSHFHALEKAIKAGKVRLDEDGHIDHDSYGSIDPDFFYTSKKRYVTRTQAKYMFGISRSEEMPVNAYLKSLHTKRSCVCAK